MKLNQFMMEDKLLQQYKQQINNQISKLNNLDSNKYLENASIHFQNIKNIDKQFINKYFAQCSSHFLYTRHGRCQNWSQKKFGFNPNAGLAEQVLNSMKNTNNFSQNLIYFTNNKLYVGVSPLLRAKQTACLVKPIKLKYQAQIFPFLAQNSIWPSGTNFQSHSEMQQEINKTQFLSNPIKLFSLKISSTLYSNNNIYQKIKQESQKCDQILMNFSQNKKNYFSNGVYSEKQNKYQFQTKQLTKQYKVKQLLKLLANEWKQQNQYDYWLFGHSGNFTYFFKHCFGIQKSFQYCQTRSIYKLKSLKEQNVLFTPPYYFIVNQNDGKIRAKFIQNHCKFAFLP